MSDLVIRTDGLLAVEPADVAVLEKAGLRYREVTCLTEESLIENCADAAGLLVLREPITERVLAALPHCRVVARFGVGVDTVDVPAATRRGVRVVNVPDANAPEVAAHAFAMIMALVRRLPQFDRAVRAGEWDYLARGRGMRRLDQLVLGIAGFGRTGRRVAECARALGMSVIVHDPFVAGEVITESGFPAVGFTELARTADVLSLHVPLTAETENLVSAEVIAGMKPGAIVVNVARGRLVDEEALAAALAEGHLSGAGLDVLAEEPASPGSKLLALDNVILTPHAGHYSAESYRETVHRAFADVARVLLGEPPRNPVN
ncbi:C-terminal binding protein [Amycolatopsis pithecellobii]|uniref:C-terminal binding protein n=1 Tax=Amycolatopsis pithecellobii TaxID=664692 RepID=A0A6N7Z284_9PSEU|nr:C-terminal binding protein [Amycolatopsis pithecellobii]MTD54969.1 C-terminal binding protein [Amycolatopsis pithecellobii]